MNNENRDLLKAYEGYADVYEKYKNKPDVIHEFLILPLFLQDLQP